MTWAFDDEDGAAHAERILAHLDARGDVTVRDGAVVTWPASRMRPRNRELENLARTAPLGTDFWGLLFGTLFVLPALNAAAASAEETGLHHLGLDDASLTAMRTIIVAGTSALFAVVPAAPPDPLAGRFNATRLIRCRLSPPHEAVLRPIARFAGTRVTPAANLSDDSATAADVVTGNPTDPG